MPANKKYLSSPFQRFAKITAGLVGGYGVTVSFFLVLSNFLDRQSVVFTLVFGGFLVWVGLLIVAFLAKNGWKIWGWYITAILVFSALFHFTFSS